MPCLLAILAIAFPRVAIVLLWLFSHFFSVLHSNILIPVVGFIFLPLTLLVYTFILRAYEGHLGTTQIVFLILAAVFDLGLIHRGTLARR
jgi:hypothetical protein